MARHTGPRLKIVRRFQAPLPGLTQKNGERRPYPPGQHGPGRRSKLSDYRIRLEEKQKLRFNYGLTERQLRKYYKKATKTKGDTGALLLQILERRLDNCVFRAGFAPRFRLRVSWSTMATCRSTAKRLISPLFLSQ
jgi:small subunit ribosomal protein S4